MGSEKGTNLQAPEFVFVCSLTTFITRLFMGAALYLKQLVTARFFWIMYFRCVLFILGSSLRSPGLYKGWDTPQVSLLILVYSLLIKNKNKI